MFADKPAQPPPDTWLLEDIQIRKLVRLNPPTEEPARAKTTPNTRPPSDLKTDMDILEKERIALRMALDLSRQEEERRQAVREQEKAERAFREGRKNKVKGDKGRGGEAGKVERTIMEAEKEMIARELLEREKEKADALRRVVEEELYNVWKERVLREQEEKEREVERNEEARREKERVRREAEAKVQREREREVLKKVKELEMENAAIAKAVEDSIITEAARRLIDKERERKRVEEMAERLRREEEEKVREERLRRRVEGRKAYAGTNIDGFGQMAGMFVGGLAAWGGDVPEIVAPYPLTGEPYPTAYTGRHKGRQDAITTPAGHEYTPPLAPRFPRPDGTTGDLGWTVYDFDIDRLDETHTTGRRKPSKDGRRWRETTAERWETVIYRQDKGRDEYRRFKETTKLTKRFG